MNFLPAMLITTAIIGGSGTVSADISNKDISSLQNIASKNLGNAQIIYGNASDLQSVLDRLGVDTDSLKDCLPSVPGGNIQNPGENKPEGDSQNPDNPGDGPQVPDTDKPEQSPELPDTDKPEQSPELPDTDKPGQSPELPETDKPGNGGNIPDIENPDNNGSAPEQDTASGYARQVVDLVNVERAKYGLPALTMQENLNAAALTRAKETTQSFSHTRPNGSSFSSVLDESGIKYRGSGENIAWGQQTPASVVDAWMNSEGHRANILNKNYTSIGVGYYLNGSTPYWAQLFTY